MREETARENRDYNRRDAGQQALTYLHALAVFVLAFAGHGVGAAPLVVEGVVSPAWVEHRDGRREPLAVGTPVESGERIATGREARVLLRMGEGSAIRLGEEALFEVEQLKAEPKGATALWRGSLDLVRGAFRYSTAALAGLRAERDLSFRANTLVAGIRGTNVWGRSDAASDFVVLIEGRVTVSHAGGEFALSEPRSMVVAPRGAPGAALARISADQLATLAAQTEISSGAGGAWKGGRNRVVVITTVDETYARSLHERLRASGFPARLRMIEQEGSPLFQVDLAQLGGEREARTLAQRLQGLGYPEARPAR